jgi:hypothetical protein
MTEYTLPRCPKHPDDFGQSEEHVFCLREDCEWTEELCWEEKVLPLSQQAPEGVVVRCMRLHGHDEDHFGYKPDGSEFSWSKQFIDNRRRSPYDFDPLNSILGTMLDKQYQPVGAPVVSPSGRNWDYHFRDRCDPKSNYVKQWEKELRQRADRDKADRKILDALLEAQSAITRFDSLSGMTDIKVLNYDPALFYSHYVAQHYSKNVVHTVHDEIQLIANTLEKPRFSETPKLAARIAANKLKKGHCSDCGSHWIKKFGTPWCQKCDKEVRDPDKR